MGVNREVGKGTSPEKTAAQKKGAPVWVVEKQQWAAEGGARVP